MSWLQVTLAVLCAWRITHLLQAEDGPGGVVAWLRRSAGRGWLGQALDCFHCLSIWVALPLAAWLGQSVTEQFLLWGALSGGACLLERATTRPAPQPLYTEDQEIAP